jgi:hypothetical protein
MDVRARNVQTPAPDAPYLEAGMPTARDVKRKRRLQPIRASDIVEVESERDDLFTYAAYRQMLAGWAQEWVERKRRRFQPLDSDPPA